MSFSNYTVTDFENLRIALMNSYNSQALTHAGYIIVLIIAIFTLVSSDTIRNLYSEGKIKRIFVYLLFSSIVGLIFYFASKIFFWSWMGSETLVVTMENATSTNSTTLIYGMQTFIMRSYNTTGFPFLSYTYSSSGFSTWSILFYLLVPLSAFLAILGGVLEVLHYINNRRARKEDCL